MTHIQKSLLLGATVWPVLYIVGFFGFILWTMAFIAGGPQAGPPPMPGFFVLFALHLLTMLTLLGLLAIYVILALKNEALDQNGRILWAIFMCVGGLIAMPIYFFKYVWPSAPQDRKPDGALPIAEGG